MIKQDGACGVSRHDHAGSAVVTRGTVGPVMGERALQDAITEAAAALGWRWYHTYNSIGSQAGWPDLILVHPGRKIALAWELKGHQRDGRILGPRRNQVEWLDWLRGARIVEARVVTPEDWQSNDVLRVLRGDQRDEEEV